jgi:hypothetical protein
MAHGQADDARAAIVVVGRDAKALQTLSRELSGRYGADYRIVVCSEPAQLDARVRDLLHAGTPVALVIGDVGEGDPDSIEVLAQVRAIDATVSRVATFRWGEWDAGRPIFDAITMGKIDHWVIRPVQSPDEDFHQSITQFLGEWRSERSGGFEAVHVIGEQWSARSQELRDTFSRNGIPIGFYDAGSARGRQMLAGLGLESAELPVVALRFDGQQSALANPSNLAIVDAFGLMTPIPDGEVDVAVGAGPAGLAAAVYASSEGASASEADGSLRSTRQPASAAVAIPACHRVDLPAPASPAMVSRAGSSRARRPAANSPIRRHSAARTKPAPPVTTCSFHHTGRHSRDFPAANRHYRLHRLPPASTPARRTPRDRHGDGQAGTVPPSTVTIAPVENG